MRKAKKMLPQVSPGPTTPHRLPRIPLPRTPLNKGKKEGRRCYTPALDDSLLGPLLQTEGLRHLRGEIGVVVHYLPSSSFTTVDVRHTPVYA